MKQSLTITKSGVTTWITPLSYDFLIVAYLFLLHLLEVGVLDVVIGVRLSLLATLILLRACACTGRGTTGLALHLL